MFETSKHAPKTETRCCVFKIKHNKNERIKDVNTAITLLEK